MTNRKSQNSILFLTTLGVYLGLVLVGATPQVLAQAATAKQFSVKDEIGRKDDLDNKPNDLAEVTGSIRDYFNEAAEYIRDIRDLSSMGKLILGIDTWDVARTIYLPCPETGTVATEGFKSDLGRWVEPLIVDAQYRVEGWPELAACRPDAHFIKANRGSAKSVVLHLIKDGLTYAVTINRADASDAVELFERFRAATHRLDRVEPDVSLKTLRDNTTFSTADNQVVISTRLPRGSLDSLLASDAK